MRKSCYMLLPLVLALPGASLAKSSAPTLRLEITARAPAYEGRTFGAHGAYERIDAIAHMRIDPRDAANRGIADLSLAPRGADGLVDYDTDVVILRPVEAAKAGRVLLYDVVNRGMRLISMFSGGDPGDGLLLRQGYTIVWSGWQGDIAANSLVKARFPVARSGSKPVTGTVSTETIFDSASGNAMALPYAATSLDQPQARLTVRAVTDSGERVIPASDWHFASDRKIEIVRPADMDAGAIYRFTYTAKDPWVMGLGFAATRDLVAWLRQAPANAGNPLADIGGYASAIGFGGSQSGRYLRDFLWQGFNRDLSGKRVFDGVIPFIPGGRRTFTNFRFAEPGRFSRQHEDHGVPGFDFPFTYATLKDPVSGKSDGLLAACAKTDTCPKVFHIDTSAEFWQAGASLVGTGGTDHDVALPANVRAYMIAGGAHAPGMTLPACRYPANALNYTSIVRALVVRMAEWTTTGAEPPQSVWPSLAKGELIPVESIKGPEVPSAGLAWPKVQNRPLAASGKAAWPVFVPRLDADGNDAPGIHLPQVAAADGTYLGWNLRKAGYGEGDLCLLAGSFIPFAKDAASRGGDGRKSLAERYPLPAMQQALKLAAIARLKSQHLLLDEDALRLATGSQ